MKTYPTIMSCIVAIIVISASSAAYYHFGMLPTMKALDVREINAKQQLNEASEQTAGMNTVIQETVLNISTSKMATDKQSAETFFQLLFSWENYDSYMQTRSRLLDEYNFKEDDEFMRTFFPNPSFETADGETHKWENTDTMNMSYREMEQHFVERKDDGTYVYLAEVYVTSSMFDAKSTGVVLMQYSVDKNNKMMLDTLEAYTTTPY